MSARPHLPIAPAVNEDAGFEQAAREVAGPGEEEVRQRRIAEAAYYRAERRGFAPGAELDDWLEAEREIEALAREAT